MESFHRRKKTFERQQSWTRPISVFLLLYDRLFQFYWGSIHIEMKHFDDVMRKWHKKLGISSLDRVTY